MLEFKREISKAKLLDPASGSEKEVSVEYRWDPITGESSRILEEPPSKERLLPEELFKEGLKAFCPFCPENVEKLTPKFLPSLFPEGRPRRGKAVAIPNLRPFDQFSAVIVLGERHFVKLEELDFETLEQGFLLAQEVLKRAKEVYPDLKYLYLNWNFLPASGGSILHPHLHAFGGVYPTFHFKRIEEACLKYWRTYERCVFGELLEEEKRRGERFLGEVNGVSFLLAFAPKGPWDICFLFPYKEDLRLLSPQDLRGFLKGLKRLFSYFGYKGVYSFNLVLYGSSSLPRGSFWVYGRLIVRRFLNSWGTSDINAFQALHAEGITAVRPEDVFKEMRPYFEREDV